MSLVLQYKFDQADLTIDSSGNSFTSVNSGVTSTVDATYGNVALFGVNDDIQLEIPPTALQDSSPRTVSVWINRSSDTRFIAIYDNGLHTTGNRLSLSYFENDLGIMSIIGPTNGTIRLGTTVTGSLDTWYHLTVTCSATEVIVYVNGVQISSTNYTIKTPLASLLIGSLRNNTINNTNYWFYGKMSDFRVYDDALSATEVSALYTEGPNPPIPITLIPRVSSVLATLGVSGATAYRITSQETGSLQENIVKDNFTDLVQTISGLTPSTEYTFRLYSTDGSGYTLVETSVVTTLANVGTNYDKNDYLSNGIFDISSLDVNLISNLLNDVFATEDVLDVKVSNKVTKSTFVNRGDTIDVTNVDSVTAPFVPGGSIGQTVSLRLSDTSTVNVTYNETNEEVTIGSVTYNTGDILVLDGKKVTIVDF